MKEFLFQLAYGIKIIPKKYGAFIDNLQKKGLIEKNNGIYSFKEGNLVGKVDISRGGRAFFCVFDGRDKKDWIIKRLPKGISQNDIVLCKIVRFKGRLMAEFISLLQAQDNRILCYLKKIKGEILAIELKNPHAKPIKLKVSQKSLLALPRFCVISMDLRTKEIVEILGALEDPLTDEKISLSLFGRKPDFSAESIIMAESFGKKVDSEMFPERKDLTCLPFCTIDPDDAKDHDDAIYFDSKTSCLYIAIADVSEYVSVDSSLDMDARERGFSVYFPHKSYPMLPKNLSENICSLKENEIRLAFIWRLRLHRRSAEVLEASLFEGMISNHKNISYTDVDRLLAGEEISMNKGVKKSILDFVPIAQKLRSKRLKKGYEFFNDELRLKLDSKGFLQNVDILYSGPSHMIVEEAMLLANRQSAQLLEEHLNEGGIYRIHDRPSQDRISELFFELKSLGFSIPASKDLHQCISSIQKQAAKKDMQKQIDKMIIKAQSQALYSSCNIGHFGLGFETYSHFTSPIRRYSDLILHRMLKQIISDSKKSEKKLAYLASSTRISCALLNEQERQSAKIEMDFKDRKYARWALKNIGIRLKGIVMDENHPLLVSLIEGIIGARIVVQDYNIEAKKLDGVQIEIIDVDIASGKIFGRI